MASMGEFLCRNLRQKFSEFSFYMAVIFGFLLKVINHPFYTGMLAFGKMGIISHRKSQHVCLQLRLNMPSEISFRSKRSTNHSGLLSSTRLWPLFNKCLATVTLLSQSTSEWYVPIVCINFCVAQKDEVERKCGRRSAKTLNIMWIKLEFNHGMFISYSHKCLSSLINQMNLLYVSWKLMSNGTHQRCLCLFVWAEVNLSPDSLFFQLWLCPCVPPSISWFVLTERHNFFFYISPTTGFQLYKSIRHSSTILKTVIMSEDSSFIIF